jgi:predicted ATPase
MLRIVLLLMSPASRSWRGRQPIRSRRSLLLDEPGAALSLTGALALLAIVTRAANSGAQFVIATHSPVLLAAPAAQIYELDEGRSRPTKNATIAERRRYRASATHRSFGGREVSADGWIE